MANIAYKYRLYPNAEQQVLFAKTFGCCRKIWNLMLADRNEAYQKDKTHIAPTPASYKKDYPFLKEVDSLALANVQLNQNKAFKEFFKSCKTKKNDRGFPKFKSAKATTIVKENKIYVDLDKFKDEIDLYLSLAHEVRHCAQYQAINDVGLEDIATPEMLKIWKKELKEYKGSENEGYEAQHIELDAFAFAWFIGVSVFGVELHLNGVRSGKQLLSSYIQFISNNYSIEELRDCLEYSGFAYNRNQA